MQPTDINQAMQEKIEKDVANYLAMGKKITEVPPGVSGDDDLPLRERVEKDRNSKLASDKERLKEYHARGEYLNIKWLPACKTKDERFRFSFAAKVMGYFPTLDEAMAFKVKA